MLLTVKWVIIYIIIDNSSKIFIANVKLLSKYNNL